MSTNTNTQRTKMIDLQCRSYKVDKTLLDAGIPIEQLEKQCKKIIIFNYEKENNLYNPKRVNKLN